ncbi:Uncharacterised protein [Mycobacterium tuberculosis]|uniref:Uncharacterized protein n=1 Tax=Mycobacterium tuberculosis TaxID=1773 RepID=A0A0U0QNG1_MYCTX|nr:Uncharacterised protein [Mycobacterium tuberculosis]CFE48165.1 Uncharacterised protein [Mycobacterium tuberculosis]CFR78117.1 Uncharacterised protein [Mycobacterium tuberculosis]CKQ19521.1 Uncharacterised protein [Mycobacterium tuberculosis]CKR98694.1 Uncharacterised protein [Mycobacterium tuberculosis]
MIPSIKAPRASSIRSVSDSAGVRVVRLPSAYSYSACESNPIRPSPDGR